MEMTHQHADKHNWRQHFHNGAGEGPPLQQPLPPQHGLQCNGMSHSHQQSYN